MKIYCTSDTHFGHNMLIDNGHRPFDFSDRLLESLSKNEGDLLIHCGDFCIGNDADHHQAFMLAAAGFKKKILVRGNHDNKSDAWYYKQGWDFVCEMFWGKFFGKQIIFSHMPVYKQKGQSTENLYSPHFAPEMNIHGHLHGDNHRGGESNTVYDYSYFYDLAPERHDFKIVNLEKIVDKV